MSEAQIIDSRYFGNKARFINHGSGNENVRPEVMRVRERQVLLFRAIRDIRAGEELLFNYNGAGDLDEFKDRYPFIE